MALWLYNTLTRKKEVFKPLKDKRVNFFVCGPTVYDYSHLGHARTYIIFDALVRYLRRLGYKVFYLQNITDIDDKIIIRAKEEKVSWKNLSRRFEKEYLKDVNVLKIESVDKYARATDHIQEIISQTERLLKKGFAYKITDGIYYDISKFNDYGRLSRRTALQAEDAVSRIDESKEKRNKGDFCLWKFSQPGLSSQIFQRKSREGEPKWKASFGDGRPGWHIEDTAITEKYFGPRYDIHAGANELIFPHHEAEIAQMEAISGKKPLVRYWLHTGLLTVKGVKMSKSLKNFISVRDFLRTYSSRLLRLFILKSHYRSPIDYSETAIEGIKKELERIDEFVEKVKSPRLSPACLAGRQGRDGQEKLKVKMTNQNSKLIKDLISKTQKDFQKAMNDDFNTPKALAVIFNLIKKVNKLIEQNKLEGQKAKEVYSLMLGFDKVLGIMLVQEKIKTPKTIQGLIQGREKARKNKDWAKADQIRKQIEKKGYKIEDTSEGPKISLMMRGSRNPV